MFDRAVSDQRQGLERLRRGTPEGDEIRIACARRETARTVDHGNVDGVAGFEYGAPMEGHEHPTPQRGTRETERGTSRSARHVIRPAVPRSACPLPRSIC